MSKLSEFGTLKPSVTSNRIPRAYEEGEYIDQEDKKRISLSQWGMIAPNKYSAVSDTEKKLPPGAYDISLDEMTKTSIFTKKKLIHDTIIPLSGLPKTIIEEIKHFWGKEKEFSRLGFLHRRGILFYGAQGSGKSSILHEIAQNTIDENGIVFYCDNPDFFTVGLSVFRGVEPSRRVVCIFEDIDATIARYGESTLLSLLDGENQISGVCNLATTNYPEKIDKRIVGRPRRFDRVYKIGNLDDGARKTFLEKKLPPKQNIQKWLKETSGLSIASISEVIISVFCFNKSLDEAVEIMRSLAEDKKGVDVSAGIGFVKGKEDLEED